MDYLKKYYIVLILTVIMLASFFLMLFSAGTDSLIIDEKVHIPAGYLHIWEGDYRFNTEHPPLLNDLAGLFTKFTKPNLPSKPLSSFSAGSDQWEYGDLFFYASGNNVTHILFWARLPFILLTLGLVYLCFIWARALFGEKAGLIAATLTAFSPNILAHGRLATTDMGLVFFFVLSCWLIRKYYFKPNWQNAVLLGLSLGLLMLTKFSAAVIFPIILWGLAVVWIQKQVKIINVLRDFVLVLMVMLVSIWGVYAFSMRENIQNSTSAYELSRTFGYREITSNFTKWLIAPFDKYARGMEILKDHNTGGHWSYLNGVVDYSGWWYYFPYVLLYKTPLSEMALLMLALGVFLFVKRTKKGFFDEFLVIFPPILFLAVAMLGKIDIGIRHILVILPFFYIFISRLGISQNLYLKPVIWILVGWQILISFLTYPNYIAYFNRIAGGPSGGINHLADSNLDWNQNMRRLGEYTKKNNIQKVYELCWDSASFEYYGIKQEILPNTPVSGVVVICAQQKMVTPEGFDISWVTKYPPDDILSGGIYIWRFPKNN